MSGQIPLWGYVAGAVACNVFLVVGMWIGWGRGWAHCEEEQRWEREQAKARAVHPVYRVRPPEVAHEAKTWDAHVADSLVLANAPAITTGEIQAITDEMDAWMAEHVYTAPADYGQWLEQEDP